MSHVAISRRKFQIKATTGSNAPYWDCAPDFKNKEPVWLEYSEQGDNWKIS